MRVLHVLDHSGPIASGYAVRSQAVLAYQQESGIEVRGLTGPKHGGAVGTRTWVDGVEFVRTPPVGGMARAVPWFREWRTMRATARRLSSAAVELRPDVIHAHSPVLNALPALAVGRRLRIPVVYEVRAFWEDAAAARGKWSRRGLRFRVTRRLETRALRRADAVVAICEGVRKEIARRGIEPDRIAVVPNGADPGEPPDRYEETADFRRGGKGPVLGYFGSFYGYEGVDLLVKALPAVLRRFPGARLVLAGGGPAEPTIRAAAADAGVADRVRFLGLRTREELEVWYEAADVLVFPRRRSRLTDLVTPLKPLEAMARGKPVLASDVGGHREIVRDGITGRLFRPDDVGALVRGLVGLLEDSPGRMALGARAREHVAAERSWPSIVGRYDAVYRRAGVRAGARPECRPRPAVAAAGSLP